MAAAGGGQMFHRVGWRAFRPAGGARSFCGCTARLVCSGARDTGGGGARSLRPCCPMAGCFAIADTCSHRLPDGSAPLLPVLAVGRSRPLRSRAPRFVTSPSAARGPGAPPSRGEPGTPPAALAPLPPSAWRLTPPQRLPGFSPCRPLPPLTWRFAPPTPRSARLCRPARRVCGGGGCEGVRHAGGELEARLKAAAAVSGHFPYGLRKRESRLAPNAKTFSAFSQVSGISPLPRGRSVA